MNENTNTEFLADDLFTDLEAVLGIHFRGDAGAVVQLIPPGANPEDPVDIAVVSAATGHQLLAALKAHRQKLRAEP
jgi:hypothetical protein